MARSPIAKEVDDAQDLTRKTDQHGQDIEGLTARIRTLEEKISDTNKFADFMVDAAGKSKVLDVLFAKMICDLMEKNDAVRAAIKKQIDEADRAFAAKIYSGFWKWILGVILAISSSLATILIQKFSK
jgi:hypothetical protein